MSGHVPPPRTDHPSDAATGSLDATARGVRYLRAGLVTAAVAGVAWFGWLGWDTGYHVDAETGAVSGPYEVWQVAGSVATLVAAVFAGARLTSSPLPFVVAPAVYLASFAVTSAARDSTGTWLVGALLLAVGTAAGAGVLYVGSRLLDMR